MITDILSWLEEDEQIRLSNVAAEEKERLRKIYNKQHAVPNFRKQLSEITKKIYLHGLKSVFNDVTFFPKNHWLRKEKEKVLKQRQIYAIEKFLARIGLGDQ